MPNIKKLAKNRRVSCTFAVKQKEIDLFKEICELKGLIGSHVINSYITEWNEENSKE